MGGGTQEEDVASDTATTLHYSGRVIGFSSVRGVGTIRTESGREVPFDLRFCAVAGAPSGMRARDLLDVGLAVAYDVGWTSSGLRATWLKPLRVSPESAGQEA